MRSAFAKLWLLFACMALGACGFAPVYAPGGGADGLRGQIDIAAPRDEEGFALVERLEERLGRSDNASYRLSADIFLSEEAVGFLPDGSISRYNVSGKVTWRLTRLNDDAAMMSGDERSFTSYAATSTTVATSFAQQDARRRLMVILADRIAQDIILSAGRL